MLSDYWYRHFWVGMPPELLIRNADLISGFIKAKGLTPIGETAIGGVLGAPAMRMAGTAGRGLKDVGGGAGLDARVDLLEEVVIRRRDFPGGIRVDHLHFEGHPYLLTPEQWQEFSGALLRTYAERLAQVQHVSFDELTSISSAMDSLPT